jgi:hypothetical protein
MGRVAATEEFIMPNRPRSVFSMGQRVRIVRNGGCEPACVVTVRDILWHFQAERYDYYLEVDGQKVAKRYSERDLEAIE